MRLALDVSAVPLRVAGAGRYVVELASRLPGAGVDTTLVARRDDVERWHAWSPDAAVVPLVPTGRLARLAAEAWRLGTTPTARAVDLWHGPHYTMPRRGTTPAVVTIHDLTFFTNPEWHESAKAVFFRQAIRFAAHHARVLICVSATTAAQLDEIVPDHAPVVIAPHGVDLERFSPEGDGDDARLAALGLGSAPGVLFVGTVEPRKGLDVLLRSFEMLGADFPGVELWLAGQAGWGLGPIEEALRTHRVRHRIRRLGYVDDDALPALMRRAAVVCYPSRGEGFGLPVLEALACGALVVTTSATVMEEVAGSAADLVPVGDEVALARALGEALTTDAATRSSRARVGRERATHFTWEASVAAHLRAYDEALGR